MSLHYLTDEEYEQVLLMYRRYHYVFMQLSAPIKTAFYERLNRKC